jgi:hypothetical protein
MSCFSVPASKLARVGNDGRLENFLYIIERDEGN